MFCPVAAWGVVAIVSFDAILKEYYSGVIVDRIAQHTFKRKNSGVVLLNTYLLEILTCYKPQ